MISFNIFIQAIKEIIILHYIIMNFQLRILFLEILFNACLLYTSECRLQKIGEEMMQDLDKETVDMQTNFDDSLLEPTVMPTQMCIRDSRSLWQQGISWLHHLKPSYSQWLQSVHTNLSALCPQSS